MEFVMILIFAIIVLIAVSGVATFFAILAYKKYNEIRDYLSVKGICVDSVRYVGAKGGEWNWWHKPIIVYEVDNHKYEIVSDIWTSSIYGKRLINKKYVIK